MVVSRGYNLSKSRGIKIFQILKALGVHSADSPVLCLLNESKYQSHVRVSVRFRSGSCLGSCPVVSGSCPGSRVVRVWVRVWFASGSCLVRIRIGV